MNRKHFPRPINPQLTTRYLQIGCDRDQESASDKLFLWLHVSLLGHPPDNYSFAQYQGLAKRLKWHRTRGGKSMLRFDLRNKSNLDALLGASGLQGSLFDSHQIPAWIESALAECLA